MGDRIHVIIRIGCVCLPTTSLSVIVPTSPICLHSGYLTWPWKTAHVQIIFPIQTSIDMGFSMAMLKITRSYNFTCSSPWFIISTSFFGASSTMRIKAMMCHAIYVPCASVQPGIAQHVLEDAHVRAIQLRLGALKKGGLRWEPAMKKNTHWIEVPCWALRTIRIIMFCMSSVSVSASLISVQIPVSIV